MPSPGEIYPPDLLDRIESRTVAGEWEGTVWRHMFADHPPSVVNVRGARWNPPTVGAIYTSLSRETALAEADYMIAMQPLRPRAERKLYELQVTIERVVDLTDPTDLEALGVSEEALGSIDMAPCRYVGEMVNWFGFGGLIVPSARHTGSNLVIYEGNLGERFSFEIVSCTLISAPDTPETP
jgi:RES domain-containing protein